MYDMYTYIFLDLKLPERGSLSITKFTVHWGRYDCKVYSFIIFVLESGKFTDLYMFLFHNSVAT